MKTLTILRRRGMALRRALLALALPLALAAPGAAQAADQDGFSAKDKTAIEAIVRGYLLEHPEVIVEALEELQRREQARSSELQTQTLRTAGKELRFNPDSPVIGNPDGDVVIVEFFDYRCPYCKQVAQALREVVEEDGNIRLVMKELPILSEESHMAARAALAADLQGRYEDFHFALMSEPGSLNEDTVFAIAEDLGLDSDRLRADMESREIVLALEEVYTLAQSLGIRGTPAFVIGDELVPGAITQEIMRRKVAEARAGAS